LHVFGWARKRQQSRSNLHPNKYYTLEGLNPGCARPLQFLRSNESRSAQAPSSDGCAGKANCGGTEPGKKFILNIPHSVTWQSAGFTLPGSAHFLMTTFMDILDPTPVPSIPRRNRNRFLGKVLAPRPGITNTPRTSLRLQPIQAPELDSPGIAWTIISLPCIPSDCDCMG
jgi:hypothetical protein